MANVSRINGFRPRRHINGSEWNGQTKMFLIPAADGTAVFRGDVVIGNGSSGATGTVVSGLNCDGIPEAIVAASGTTGQSIVGVVVDFLVDPTNLTLKYRVASTNRIALVCCDPTVIYEVQEDGVSANLANTDVEANCAFTLTAGSTVTGDSAMALDSDGQGTAATLPLKILGLVKRVDNAFGLSTTDLAKFEVMFNTGLYMPNTLGL